MAAAPLAQPLESSINPNTQPNNTFDNIDNFTTNSTSTLTDTTKENTRRAQNSQPDAHVSEDHASPSEKPSSGPFIRYSRRTLVFLSKSPLVALPSSMPSLKEWFGDWTEPHSSPKKDTEHTSSSGSLATGRHRLRRDQGEDDSRPSYKSQFSQASQMGNFRHHSSRLDDKGDRDTHERLRNLSDTYDRNRLLGNSNISSRRDSTTHVSRASTSISSSLPLPPTRRGDSDKDRDSARDRDGKDSTTRERTDTLAKDRREAARGEKSDDWRRADRDLDGDSAAEVFAGAERTKERRSDRTTRLRSRSREPQSTRGDRFRDRERRDDRIRDSDDREWERITRGGRRSPSPILPPISARTDRWVPSRAWDGEPARSRMERDDTRDRDTRSGDRRARTNDLDDHDDFARRNDKGVTNGRENRRTARDTDRDRDDDRRTDTRGARDRERDRPRERERDREKEKEPAWMGDYVPEAGDSNGGLLGGRLPEGGIDDLQAWKREIKEKERAAAGLEDISSTKDTTVMPASASVGDALDDIQRFQLRIKEEQEKRERATKESSAPTPPSDVHNHAQIPPPPPGLSVAIPSDSSIKPSTLSALHPPLEGVRNSSTEPSSLVDPPIPLNPLLSSAPLLESITPHSPPASENKYPDLIPARPTASFQSTLNVAGLGQDPSQQARFRSDSRASNTTPSLGVDTRVVSMSTVSASSRSPSQSSIANGRSTPTMSGFSSQIDSVRGTTSSQTSSPYNGDGGSPGSGAAQPAYAQGKGSRFAKFWDHKPKEQNAPSIASQPQQQLPPPQTALSTSSSQPWSINSLGGDPLRPSRPQARTVSGGSDLNGLFHGLLLGGDPPFERQERPVPNAGGGSSGPTDGERMQNLLSMLSPPQGRSSGRETQDPLSQMFRSQPSAPPERSLLSLGLHQSYQPQAQALPFSPIGSPDLDRGFVPDGLVPGLRPPLQQRAREPSVQPLSVGPHSLNSPGGLGEPLFNDDEGLARPMFNVQRLPPNQQAFEQLHSRPVPPLYSNQAPGPISSSRNGSVNVNLNGLSPLNGGAFGMQQSSLRHSPNAMTQQVQQHTPSQPHQRGYNGNIAVGRPNYDLALNLGNLGGGGGNGGNVGGLITPGGSISNLQQQQQQQQQFAGGFNHNAPPRSIPLSQPPHPGIHNGRGGFGNIPPGIDNLDFAVQQQHQRELQARQQLLNVQQQQQPQHQPTHLGGLGGGIRNGGSGGMNGANLNINISRLMQATAANQQPSIPSSHHHFQQQPQPSVMRQQPQQQPQHGGGQGQGLPFNMMIPPQLGLGQPQVLGPPQHHHQQQQHLNGLQQQQLGLGTDFALGHGHGHGHGHGVLPPHLQPQQQQQVQQQLGVGTGFGGGLPQGQSHTQSGGVNHLGGLGGLGGPHSQTDLMALLMGGHHPRGE